MSEVTEKVNFKKIFRFALFKKNVFWFSNKCWISIAMYVAMKLSEYHLDMIYLTF